MPTRRRIRLPAGEPAAVDDSKWACPDCGVSVRAAAMAGLTHVCLSPPSADGESSAYLNGFAGVAPPAIAPVEDTDLFKGRNFRNSASGNSRGYYRHLHNFAYQRGTRVGGGISDGENLFDEEDDASSVTLTADLQTDANLESEAIGGDFLEGSTSFSDSAEGLRTYMLDRNKYDVSEIDVDENAVGQTSPFLSPRKREVQSTMHLRSSGEVHFQAGDLSHNRHGARNRHKLSPRMDVTRETDGQRHHRAAGPFTGSRVPAKPGSIPMASEKEEEDSEFRALVAKTALSRLGHKWAVADQVQASLIAASTTPHKRATAAHAIAVAISPPTVVTIDNSAAIEANAIPNTPKPRTSRDKVDHFRTPHSSGRVGISNRSVYYSAQTHVNESNIDDGTMPISPLTEASVPAHEDMNDFSLTPNAHTPSEVGPLHAAPSPWVSSVSRIQGFSNHRSRSASPRTLSPRTLSPRSPRSGNNDGTGSGVSNWRQRLGLIKGRSRRGRSASPRPAARYLATVNAQNRAHSRGTTLAQERITKMSEGQRYSTLQPHLGTENIHSTTAPPVDMPSTQDYSATVNSNFERARIRGRTKDLAKRRPSTNTKDRGRKGQSKVNSRSQSNDSNEGKKAGFWDADGRWHNFVVSERVNNVAKEDEHLAKLSNVVHESGLEHKSPEVSSQPMPPHRSSLLHPDSPPEAAHHYHRAAAPDADEVGISFTATPAGTRVLDARPGSKDREPRAAAEGAKSEAKKIRNEPLTTPLGTSASSSSSSPLSIGTYSPGVVAAAARAQAFRAYKMTPSARATPLSSSLKSAALSHQVKFEHSAPPAFEDHEAEETKPTALPFTAFKKGIKMTPSPGGSTIPLLDSNYEAMPSSPPANGGASLNLLRNRLNLTAVDKTNTDTNAGISQKGAEEEEEVAEEEREIEDDNEEEGDRDFSSFDRNFKESLRRSRTASSSSSCSSYARMPSASADLANVLGTDARRDALLATVLAAAASEPSPPSSPSTSSSSCLTPSTQAALARCVKETDLVLDCVLRNADDISDPTLDFDRPPAWELTEKHHNYRTGSHSSEKNDETNPPRHRSENDINDNDAFDDDGNYFAGSLVGEERLKRGSSALAAAAVVTELLSQLSLGLITPSLAGDRAASAFAATHTLCLAASRALPNTSASRKRGNFATSSGNIKHSFNSNASSEDENNHSDSSSSRSRSRSGSRNRSRSPSSQNRHCAAPDEAAAEAAVMATWQVKRALRLLQHVVRGVSLDLALAASAAAWASSKTYSSSDGIGANADNSGSIKNGMKQSSFAHASAANQALSERVLLHFRTVMPVLGLTVLTAVRTQSQTHCKAVPTDVDDDHDAEENDEEDLLMDLVLPVSVEICALFSAFLQPGETFDFASSHRNPTELIVTQPSKIEGETSSRERTIVWAHALQSKFLLQCNPGQKYKDSQSPRPDINTGPATTDTSAASAATAMEVLLSGQQEVSIQLEVNHVERGRQRSRSRRRSGSHDHINSSSSSPGSRGTNYSGGAYNDAPSWEESRQRMALLLALALEPAAPATARFAGYCCSLGALGERKDHRTALRWWHIAAEQGDARACLNAGLLRQAGHASTMPSSTTRASEENNAEDAEAWFRLGAERGWPPAMLALALLLLQADGRDATDGRVYLSTDTVSRNISAHTTDTSSIDQGAVVAEGEQWAQRAAELGDPDAQFLVASRLETKAMHGPLPLEDEAALLSEVNVEGTASQFTGTSNMNATTTVAAATGAGTATPTASSLSALAWMPVPAILQDVPPLRAIHPGALSWFQRAAEGGHPGAQFRLGVMHDEAFLAATTARSATASRAVLQHHAREASRWLLLAAAQNHSWAMHRVAQLVSSGRLVDFTSTTSLPLEHKNSSPNNNSNDHSSSSGNDHSGGDNFQFWPVDNALAARLLARASCPEAKFALGCLVADWPLGESHKLTGVLPNHELLLNDGAPSDDPQQDSAVRSRSSSRSSSRDDNTNNSSSRWRGSNLAEAAVRLWREAAAEECVDAAVLLGHMYHRGGCSTGMGIAEDRYAAEAYWRSAAEVGDLGAMVLLGELLLENVQIYVTSSLEKDEGDFEVSDDQEAWDSTDSGAMEAEAKAWWHEAAARGSVEAAEKLKEYINV